VVFSAIKYAPIIIFVMYTTLAILPQKKGIDLSVQFTNYMESNYNNLSYCCNRYRLWSSIWTTLSHL